jgi:hypothetical protein
MYSTARPREQIVEYQKGVTGANVERAVFSNDSALGTAGSIHAVSGICVSYRLHIVGIDRNGAIALNR